MSKYDIEYLSSNEIDVWDELVNNSPTGTLFHKSYWLESVTDSVRYCTVKKGQEIIGGVPITPKKKYGIDVFGHPPLTPYSGIVFADMSQRKYVSAISEKKSVCEELARELKSHFHRVHFYTTPGYQRNLIPFKWADYSFNLKYTYLLDVTDLDTVWDEFDGRRRNDIRKAQEDGVSVNREATIDETLSLVQQTFERQDKSFESVSKVRTIHDELASRNRASAFVAHDDGGLPIAASYVVWDDNRAYYLLGGYDDENGHHGATALALWRAIEYVRNTLGLNTFDFEGSEIPSIERFFRKFGGRVQPYYGLIWTDRWLRPMVALRGL